MGGDVVVPRSERVDTTAAGRLLALFTLAEGGDPLDPLSHRCGWAAQRRVSNISPSWPDKFDVVDRACLVLDIEGIYGQHRDVGRELIGNVFR
jgi:hypothetical protein